MFHSIYARPTFAKPRSWLLLGIWLLALAGMLRLAAAGTADTETDSHGATPDSCVLHVNVLEGTTVTIDGRDFANRRRFVFNKLERHKPYRARVELRFPDGRSDSWVVPIAAGRVIHIGVEGPAPRLSQPEPRPSAVDASDTRAVAQGCNGFGLDLFGQLAQSDGNLVFSPASLEAALAMTSAGAAARTHEQMIATLRLTLPAQRSHAALGRLLMAWNHVADAVAESSATRPYELSVANSVWVQPDMSLRPDFVQACRKHYGAGLQQVDFRSREAARATINAWVSSQTHGRITELMPSDALPETTRMVLTNAIHFKGKWERPFDSKLTATAPFHVSEDRTGDVATMHLRDRFAFHAAADLQVLELPYAGDDLSLVVLLPTQGDGVDTLGKQLSAARLADLLDRLEPQLVEVSLPKFRLESQFQLRHALAALGMSDAFSQRADFSGISRDVDLRLSDVVHRTEIELNEEGTEAAAASAAVATVKSMKVEEPIRFQADHPFVFLVRDRISGVVLFLGRVVDPNF